MDCREEEKERESEEMLEVPEEQRIQENI